MKDSEAVKRYDELVEEGKINLEMYKKVYMDTVKKWEFIGRDSNKYLTMEELDDAWNAECCRQVVEMVTA